MNVRLVAKSHTAKHVFYSTMHCRCSSLSPFRYRNLLHVIHFIDSYETWKFSELW
jgi:hypothetical protein